MKTVKELNEDLAELTEEAQALQNLSDSDDGLNADQQARWEQLLDEDNGLLTQKGRELASAKKYEGERKRLATMRLLQEGPIDNPLAGSEFDLQTGEIDPRQLAHKVGQRALGRSTRMQAFPNTPEGRADAYNCGQYLIAMLGNRDAEKYCERIGWDIRATATEGTDTAGGYLVPAPLEAAFVEFREQVAVLRQLADVHPMMSQTLDVPKLTSGPSVTYPGEATAPTPSDQVWGSIRLNATKRMVLSKVSNELQADAVVNYIDRLVSRAAYEIALQEDNEAVNGDGTATYGNEMGLLSSLGAGGTYTAGTGDDTWPELDITDFTGTMELLPDEHWGSPVWLCSMAFYHGVMLRVQAQAGGNTIATLESGGASRPMFLGYPVFTTSRMPTATAASTVSALFGTFRDGLMLGDRQAVTIGTSADRYFDEDVTAVRLTERIDWNVHEEGDASNAGAYVGLSTNS